MTKQLFTKTTKQPPSINLGRGAYVKTALHAHIMSTLPAQKRCKNINWVTYKCYKTP